MPKNVFNGAFVTSDGEVPSAARWNSLGLFGDGSDGSYTSGDNLTPGKVYNFTDFVLNSGDTLSSTASNSGEPIIIKVQGNVEINGTINLENQGYPPGRGLTNNNQGGRGAQVMVGIGGPGQNGYREFVDGGFDSGTGGNGGTEFPPEIFMNGVTQPLAASGSGGGGGKVFSSDSGERAGAGGGGASYAANGQSGGRESDTNGRFGTGGGGQGGGSIVFIANGDLSFTGTINIQGQDGGSANGAGGGGGAGGMFYGLYTGSLTDTGTKLVAGGNGGSGNRGANGGDGANGTVLFEPVS